MVNGLEGVEWPRQEIEGHGQFTVTAQDLAFDVVLRAEATGMGADRIPQLTVESITVASQPTFHLDEKSLTIEGSTIDQATLDIWKRAAADAFNSADAGKALTGKLVDTLADPSFRDQFSSTVTAQLVKALDGVLGAVPAGSLPSDDSGFPAKYGPLELYLFDRLRASVNDTGSGFYPPTVVLGATDPTLEPYGLGDLDLGSYKIGVATADLGFKRGSIKGISNVLIPVKDAALTDGGIGATLRFGQLPGDAKVPAPPLTITGRWSVSFPDAAAAAAAAPEHATTNDDDDTIEGDITIKIDQPSATAGLSFSGRDADELTIGLDALTLAIVTKDLQITVDFDQPTIWKAAIEKVLNKDEVKQKIIDGVQSTADTHRADIAKELTDNARTVIHTKLEG
ncbi:hypothetical protein VR41_11690 [Streptomyces sp. NRRL B-1568]|nr:hypothetical protein VR41_11690 [Streptomyces sp. NRRL B-1568]